MNTLVSLVSEQTIPNLELIIEFREKVDKYLFFHSDKTIQNVEWLIRAAKLDTNVCYKQVIDPFDLSQIQSVLQSYRFGDESFILNITGGTKPWIMAFLERFKDLGAEIYYVTGKPREYLKIHPRKGEMNLILKESLSIIEYLEANGFEVSAGKTTHDLNQAQRLFNVFMSRPIESFSPIISYLRTIRNSGKKIEVNSLSTEIQNFLAEIKYECQTAILSKSDFKYLSGDWLEEWVFFKLKEELGFDESMILTGSIITKNKTPNEIDVMFLLNHQLFIIECKTAVSEDREQPDGSTKPMNILGETIYKSDALRSKLGLFAKSTILTLSELLSEDLKPLQQFQTQFDRAQLSNINLVSRRKLNPDFSFKQLLGF